MDVEQATLVVPHEVSAENAHETGEYHEFGIEGVDQFDQRGIEGLAAIESLVIQGAGIDTRVPGALQAVGVGAVGNHRSNADRAVAGPRAVDQGLDRKSTRL